MLIRSFDRSHPVSGLLPKMIRRPGTGDEGVMPTAVDQTWHMYDSQGQFLALAFSEKS